MSEFRVYGIADGYREPDQENPGTGFPDPVDTTGTGSELKKFRGRNHHPHYINRKKREDRTNKAMKRARRHTKFLDNYLER